MRKKSVTSVFLRHVAEAHETASNSGVATLQNFCRARGPQKCLLGSSPNPLYFGTNCPKVPVRCTVVCGPSLSFLGLIFTLVCYAEQMINVRFYCHGLPHLPLGLPVFCIKFFFLSRQLTAGFF